MRDGSNWRWSTKGMNRKKQDQKQEMKGTDYTFIHSFIHACDKYWMFGNQSLLNLVRMQNVGKLGINPQTGKRGPRHGGYMDTML